MAARLRLVAAPVHRAPAAATGGRAIVEARRTGLGRADADAARLVGRAEHPGGVERDRGDRLPLRLARGALAEDEAAAGVRAELRQRRRFRQPPVDLLDRGCGCAPSVELRPDAAVDRLAQVPRLVEQAARDA